MSKVLWLVVIDLWNFVTQPMVSTFRESVTLHSAPPLALPSPPTPAAVPSVVPEVTSYDAGIIPLEHVRPGAVAYIATHRTELVRSPYLEYDGCLTTVHFGDAAHVHSFSGRYARVLVRGREGWVRKDALTPERSLVWPQLYEGNCYGADSPVVIAIRHHIDDAFLCAPLLLPLQATEYVMYRLLQDRRSISWPEERPRVAGEWQRILRGSVGIHISVRPLTGALIEYRSEGIGMLGFVESVAPDDSIVVSEVGRDEVGVYTSTLYSVDQWREFRPVFIEVL